MKKFLEYINIIILILVFACYRELPVKIQVYLPLFLGICFGVKIIYQIYKKYYWEEIVKTVIFFIVAMIFFPFLYRSAYKFDDSLMKPTLLVIGWMFPVLAAITMVSWKRRGEIDRLRKGRYALVYFILLAIFCTIVAIVK
ncbi:hypothetical protein [Clostridium sp. YIM B02551]|uniref:hypothetical protein n=1 Tax=Clostridium sp. YIM B02551 TaxID=2910679 RepID=UPI001EEB334B|nr:hypothetical protein [Clostridium sp. YIM B02551]